MKSVLTWVADVLLGPRCPLGCGYRARGWRTLNSHCDYEHPGETR